MNSHSTPMKHETPLSTVARYAPDFTLRRSDYQTFSLRDVRGKPAVVVFYPGDWEPVSTEQLRLYDEYLPDLLRYDATLVAISVDSVWSHAAFRHSLGLAFPLLSDAHPKGQVARAYDVYREPEGRSGRALFVIDPAGLVRWSRSFPINLNPGVHGILKALRALDDASPIHDLRPHLRKSVYD